jgi:hypothetical protein
MGGAFTPLDASSHFIDSSDTSIRCDRRFQIALQFVDSGACRLSEKSFLLFPGLGELRP